MENDSSDGERFASAPDSSPASSESAETDSCEGNCLNPAPSGSLASVLIEAAKEKASKEDGPNASKGKNLKRKATATKKRSKKAKSDPDVNIEKKNLRPRR